MLVRRCTKRRFESSDSSNGSSFEIFRYKNNKKFILVKKNGYNLFLFLTEPLKVKILLTRVKKQEL